jgi:hypothetical protein
VRAFKSNGRTVWELNIVGHVPPRPFTIFLTFPGDYPTISYYYCSTTFVITNISNLLIFLIVTVYLFGRARFLQAL